MSNNKSDQSINLEEAAKVGQKITEEKNRSELIKTQATLKYQNSQLKAEEDRRKREERLRKYLAQVGKTVEEHEHREDTTAIGNIASMLMDSRPRYVALTHVYVDLFYKCMDKFIKGLSEISKDNSPEFAQQLIWGPPVLSTQFVQGIKNLFASKEPLSMPDLKYFVTVNPDGEISQGWGPIINNIFPVPYPDPKTAGERAENTKMEEARGAFSLQLQNAVESWLENHNYHIVEHNGVRKIYPENKLNYVAQGNTWSVQAGCDDDFLKEADFIKLRDSETEPEKSLEHFINAYYQGLNIELMEKEDDQPTRGMIP